MLRVPASRPTIAVLGATGAQGGGLVRHLLGDPGCGFAVRALTRTPHSPAARALADAGADVAEADLDDPATLRRAFADSHGVFAVTSYWEHGSPDRELLQARNIANAARDAAVRHLVWSTLEDTRRWVALDDDHLPTLAQRYKVPHFDAKGAANAFFRERGVPTTLLHVSFQWDNLLRLGLHPVRDAGGQLVFTLPMDGALLPGIAAADIGPCAAALFASGDAAIGRSVGIAGEHLSGAQMAALLGRALGEPVRHASPTPRAYATGRSPSAPEMANMFQFCRDFATEFCARRPVDATRALHPRLMDFAGWLAVHARQLPAA